MNTSGWPPVRALRRRDCRAGFRRLLALVMTFCLFLFSVSGCVSTKVVSEASLDSDTSVSLAVYLEEKDRRRGRPTVDGVITELYYLDSGQRQLLRREVSGHWRMGGLVPGDYAADVRCLVTDDGQWEESERRYQRDLHPAGG